MRVLKTDGETDMGTVSGHCPGTVRALYGHCTGTVKTYTKIHFLKICLTRIFAGTLLMPAMFMHVCVYLRVRVCWRA